MVLIYQVIVILLMILCPICIVGADKDEKELRNIMAAILIACVFSFPLTMIF